LREQTAGVGKRFFGGYRRFFAPSKKWGYISNESGGFCGTVKTVPYRGVVVSKKDSRRASLPLEETPLLGEMSAKQTEGSAVCG